MNRIDGKKREIAELLDISQKAVEKRSRQHLSFKEQIENIYYLIYSG
jgi:predicted transcriptional regulator